jgi:outer membrane lipoprotein-sorting protein
MKTFVNNLLIALSLIFIATAAVAQDASDLLRKMDELMLAPKDKQATVQIILLSKNGKEKEREAEMKQKGKDYRLYRYTKPESQAGIATLSLPDDIMWMYMPAFGKPKKISLLAKSQAFTGTDFSYEDMESRPYAERYTPTLLETTESAYIIQLVPIPDKSKYTKIILTLDKNNFYPEMMEFYDKGDNHFKTATYKYRKGDPYWYAEEVIMTDHKKDHSTTILMNDVIFDQGIPDEVFDVENLAPAKEEEGEK